MKKIIALLLGIILAVSFISCAKEEEGEIIGGEKSPYKAEDTALKSENYSFSRAEVSYAFYQNYNDLKYSNQESLDMYNIDTSRSLKDQVYYDDVTWFSYIADMTVEYMNNLLVLLEAAKAEGMTLTEEEMETVEENVKAYKEYAKNYDYTEAEFFVYLFNYDVTADVIRSYMEKEALAFKYYNTVLDSYEFADDDLSAHVEENRGTFYYVDYIAYTFDEGKDGDALEAADEAAKITDAAAFDQYILSHKAKVKNVSEDEVDTEDCHYIHRIYDEYSEFSKWAYSDGAKDGMTFKDYDEVDGEYKVYFLKKAPYKEDYVTKNIRYIVTKVETHITADKAKAHAEDLLEQWKAGEATEHSFGELAYNESEDTNSNLKGGLVEGVSKYQEGIPSDMIKWLFEEERSAGDTGIFKQTGYYYTVYFVSDGDLKWKEDATASMRAEKYNAYQDELFKKYSVEKIDEVINSIDA